MSKIQGQTIDFNRGILISAWICDISNLPLQTSEEERTHIIRQSGHQTWEGECSSQVKAQWPGKENNHRDYAIFHFLLSIQALSFAVGGDNQSGMLGCQNTWPGCFFLFCFVFFPYQQKHIMIFLKKPILILYHYEFLRKHRSQWPHIQCDMKAETERSKCPCTILIVDLLYKKEFQIAISQRKQFIIE